MLSLEQLLLGAPPLNQVRPVEMAKCGVPPPPDGSSPAAQGCQGSAWPPERECCVSGRLLAPWDVGEPPGSPELVTGET